METKTLTKNHFDRFELAGAFGDLGTLLPFLIAFISIVGIDPLGLFFTFGIFLIVVGIYFKTPFPVQPMKSIAGVAITQVSIISPNMIWGAGIFTGLFWLILGLTGALKYITKFVTKPVVRGIIFGLGFSFFLQATTYMRQNLIISIITFIITVVLLASKRAPAMIVLLVLGILFTIISTPEIIAELFSIRPHFRLPQFTLQSLTWKELSTGIFILAIPQIPLTLGNAIIATTAENNRLFPDRLVSEKRVSIFSGIINLISPLLGGVPVCHGVGGMVANVRFGAKTGGSVIILGSIFLLLALFFSNSILLILSMIPTPVLGVILFFVGIELVMTVRDIELEKSNLFILFVTAGLSIWNVGVGFIIGLLVQEMIKHKFFRV